jgi:hypothetical protein
MGDESERMERRRARALLLVNRDQKRESRRACQRQAEPGSRPPHLAFSRIKGQIKSSAMGEESERAEKREALSSPEILAPMGSPARHCAAEIRSTNGSAQFSRKSSVRLIGSSLSLSRSLPPLSAQLSCQNRAQILKSRELHAHLE